MEETFDIIYSLGGGTFTELHVGRLELNWKIEKILHLLGGKIIAIYGSLDNRVNDFVD